MDVALLAVFVPACFALNMAFGPNNLLSLTHGARAGLGAAVLAGGGRLLAFAPMIALAALGLGAVLAASELLFTGLKLVGALYLTWLGWRMLRTAGGSGSALAAQGPRPALGAMARREFLVALGNPKAILIFTAFFPQFVEPASYWTSFLVLGLMFLALEAVAIGLYGLLGARLSGVARRPGFAAWIDRASGATMIGFGVLLALARRPTA